MSCWKGMHGKVAEGRKKDIKFISIWKEDVICITVTEWRTNGDRQLIYRSPELCLYCVSIHCKDLNEEREREREVANKKKYCEQEAMQQYKFYQI